MTRRGPRRVNRCEATLRGNDTHRTGDRCHYQAKHPAYDHQGVYYVCNKHHQWGAQKHQSIGHRIPKGTT